MENQVKKEWEIPALETLNVSETMYGRGTTNIDWVTTDDMDVYTPS
ncbi:paeninodin family lasso peptide [Paenibacillus alkalitolerans]|nr:paeninodin family lasso peptide [Paenibacillus alkalitolerans]